MSLTVWFWQRMVTPHMVYLAVALAQRGHSVTYIAEEVLSAERAALGWKLQETEGISLRLVKDAQEAVALVRLSPPSTIHLTQGLRSNGLVSAAQAAIRASGRGHFVAIETVDQRGVLGHIRSALYAWHLHRSRGLDGILAIGADTPEWLTRLAPTQLAIYPFAYFLPEQRPTAIITTDTPFRFLYVGALIPRKRVDLLLETLGKLKAHQFELEIVGDGVMKAKLASMAEHLLPSRVKFTGVLPITEIPARLAQADCLVLPSSHDGWGAVVSEALMAGTPAVCSSSCGAKGVVEASGRGGVFAVSDPGELRQILAALLDRGKMNAEEREELRSWANCLGARAGAAYVEQLLQVTSRKGTVPLPPWQNRNASTTIKERS